MAKKISVGTWAYIWGGYADEPIALPVVVKKLQEYKFDGVELGIFAPHLSLDDAKDLNKVREVKKLLDDHGLAVSGIAADLGKTPPMLASLPDYLDNVLRHVEICEILGTKKLRTDTIVPPTEIPGGMDYETCFWRTAHTFREASKVTGAHGIDFIWEFEPGFLFNKPSEIIRMCYTVGHKNFGVLFDSCHAHMCAVVRRAADGREGNAARRRGAVRPHADRLDQARPLHRQRRDAAPRRYLNPCAVRQGHP